MKGAALLQCLLLPPWCSTLLRPPPWSQPWTETMNKSSLHCFCQKCDEKSLTNTTTVSCLENIVWRSQILHNDHPWCWGTQLLAWRKPCWGVQALPALISSAMASYFVLLCVDVSGNVLGCPVQQSTWFWIWPDRGMWNEEMKDEYIHKLASGGLCIPAAQGNSACLF